MAQFTVNPRRFDPVQKLQVSHKVGRTIRRWNQQGRQPQAHYRSR